MSNTPPQRYYTEDIVVYRYNDVIATGEVENSFAIRDGHCGHIGYGYYITNFDTGSTEIVPEEDIAMSTLDPMHQTVNSLAAI